MAIKITPSHIDDLPGSAEAYFARTQCLLVPAMFETKHAITTIKAQREVVIMMPVARAFELRAMDYEVVTVATQGVPECGRMHCMEQYVFRKRRCERCWLELTTRYSRLGISICMMLSQLRGLYRYLSKLWSD